MPMVVVTLTKVPNSLRGDLTKWLQEISTGVYVGNVNSRIREKLWERIIDNIKDGQATMCYAKYNEIGYDFLMHNTKREVVYYDRIPLVFLPKEVKNTSEKELGFSRAAKYEKIKRISRSKKNKECFKKEKYVFLDIETTGINSKKDSIIEIAAIKVEGSRENIFQHLIKIGKRLKKEITELTGITDEMLTIDGKDLSVVLDEFLHFVGDATIIGYNVKFDMDFLNVSLEKSNKEIVTNKSICLLREVKRKDKFLRDYKLGTVLEKYNISTDGLHRAYADARAGYELAIKLNVFKDSK